MNAPIYSTVITEMKEATARAFAADKIHRSACADGLTYGDPFFDAAQQELDAAGIAYDAARAKTWAEEFSDRRSAEEMCAAYPRRAQWTSEEALAE